MRFRVRARAIDEKVRMRREHLCARVRGRVRGRGSVLVRDHSDALHLGQAHL